MKKTLITAFLFFAFAAPAFAAPVCNIGPNDAGYNNDNPQGAMVRHGDGTWQVQCPRIDITLVNAPEGVKYETTFGDGSDIFSTDNSTQYAHSGGSFNVTAVDGTFDGYTFERNGCTGTFGYGDIARCSLTFTQIAPPQSDVVAGSAPTTYSAPQTSSGTGTPVVIQIVQSGSSTSTAATTSESVSTTTSPEEQIANLTAEVASLKAQIAILAQFIVSLILGLH